MTITTLYIPFVYVTVVNSSLSMSVYAKKNFRLAQLVEWQP